MKQLETRNVLWPAVKTVDGSQMIIYPIEVIRENTYFFVLFDNHPAHSMPVMEEILLVIGTILYKNLFVIYNEIWGGNVFLKRLIRAKEGNIAISQLLAEGKDHGLRMSTVYQIVIGRFMNLEKYQFNGIQLTHREEKYISSFHSLKKIFSRLYNKKLVMLGDVENWQYVLLLQGNCEKIDDELEYISRRIELVMNEKIIFFMGGMCQSLTEAVSSYWELNGSINHMTKTPDTRVVGYKAKNIEELLEEIPQNQSRTVCEETLKELAYPETDLQKELRKTLEVYLECGCSIAETSKSLFIHRNTVRYRIKKCEEILNMEITPSKPHFDLQLCLKLSR